MTLSAEARSDFDGSFPEAAGFWEILVREAFNRGKPEKQGCSMKSSGGFGRDFLETKDFSFSSAGILAGGPSEPGQGGCFDQMFLGGRSGRTAERLLGDFGFRDDVERGGDHLVQVSVEERTGGAKRESSPGHGSRRVRVHPVPHDHEENFLESRDFSDDRRFLAESGLPSSLKGDKRLADGRICLHVKVLHRGRQRINARRLWFVVGQSMNLT